MAKRKRRAKAGKYNLRIKYHNKLNLLLIILALLVFALAAYSMSGGGLR